MRELDTSEVPSTGHFWSKEIDERLRSRSGVGCRNSYTVLRAVEH